MLADKGICTVTSVLSLSPGLHWRDTAEFREAVPDLLQGRVGIRSDFCNTAHTDNSSHWQHLWYIYTNIFIDLPLFVKIFLIFPVPLIKKYF